MLRLILLLFLALAAWQGYRVFKWVSALQNQVHRSAHPGGRRPEPEPDELEAEEMIECRICGAFVPVKGAQRCERKDCPW